MNILLKAATIVDASQKDHHLKKRDIHVKDGTIRKIASNIPTPRGAKVLDKENLHVSVGWFDSGVAFGEPGFEERETIDNGLKVAGLSGFTDIVLLPNTHPVPDTSSDIVFLKKMAASSATSLHPLGTISKGSKGENMAELYDMHKAGAVGFYDHQKPVTNANLLKIALQYSQGFNGLIYSYPMNASMGEGGVVHEGSFSTSLGLKGIPEVAESMHIARDISLLNYTGGRLHIPTISTRESIDLIRQGRKSGHTISCSVAIHSLVFTDEALKDFDSRNKVLPPLRDESTRKALLKALVKGDIDLLTSNHIPMDIEQKRVEFENAAFGALGLETLFGLLNSLVTTEEAVGILTRGWERFGLETPRLEEGAPAKLSLFDPEVTYRITEKDLQSKSKNSMALDYPLKGRAYGIIANNTSCI